ncbi:MAG: V-type ATP synthase subunit D [Erysipelothrix sp.]|nr:V-type ATP synthase subunit D [Erysipelothrix sp.]
MWRVIRMKVNANRMALRELRHRLSVATRGHSLLKDKQDALIQRFMVLSENSQILRRQVDAQFVRVNDAYKLASLENDDELLQYHLNQTETQLNVVRSYSNVLSLKIPNYELNIPESNVLPDTLFGIHSRLLAVSEEYVSLAQRLVQLAQEENACFVLGEEIKKTRRRVNALEFKTIPEMERMIRSIQIQIDDQERAQLSRIIQVK